MTDSMNLVTAQISFLEPHLALIHIPISLYSTFLQPIFRLLFGEDHDEDAAKIPWTNRHDFLNITINSIECSVICSRTLADRLFVPLLTHYRTLFKGRLDMEIGYEEYMVIQVDGQGLDAGQRVLELTSPLAMAGISLFFITTYFCDYILVPSRARRTVTKALEQRGFVFSKTADAFVSQLSPSSPTLQQHRSPNANSSPSSNGSMPSTPPAKDISELQTRTFTKLQKSKISPLVDDSIRLINCAGNREPDFAADETLKNDLMQILLSTTISTLGAASNSPPTNGSGSNINNLFSRRGKGLGVETLKLQDEPDTVPDFSTRFISITITSTEPISIFMEQRLIERFGSTLLGAKTEEDTLIPITLDLRELPMEATGIVCGVAGRLAQGWGASDCEKELGVGGEVEKDVNGEIDRVENRREGDEEVGAIDITFLSTAKAGTVLVKACELERAVAALEWGQRVVARD